jgi:hypothetical protein
MPELLHCRFSTFSPRKCSPNCKAAAPAAVVHSVPFFPARGWVHWRRRMWTIPSTSRSAARAVDVQTMESIHSLYEPWCGGSSRYVEDTVRWRVGLSFLTVISSAVAFYYPPDFFMYSVLCATKFAVDVAILWILQLIHSDWVQQTAGSRSSFCSLKRQHLCVSFWWVDFPFWT